MSYGTILLHLGDTPGLEARIDAAIHLARRHGSHLVALAATGNARFETSLGAGLLPREQLREALAAARRLADERARRFAERVMHSTLESHEVVIDDRDDAQALTQCGLHADLAVVGCPGADDDQPAWHRHEFERAVLEAAPPTLVLPALSAGAELGRRVLVAWKRERACARAIAAALPILRRAEQVRIVHVDTPFEDVVGGTPAGDLERARDRLCRDGVPADAVALRSSLDPGSALLEELERSGADLLVMGAWGRPPWSERVFGGCTRTVLARLPVPALLAH